MQKRFEGNYCVEYFIDEDMYAYEVPKFLLQPFVENVFVHGFEGKSYQGKMIIRCFIEKDERVYMVEDNGVGIEKEKIEEILDESGTNIGITNIIKRINLNYGEGYGVEITSEVGTGTKVTVRLPLQKNKSMI
jgi:two-component system sensor histidine kinase YesM